jgi:hypothetical protein
LLTEHQRCIFECHENFEHFFRQYVDESPYGLNSVTSNYLERQKHQE